MPNRSMITARVVDIGRSQQFEGKWRLALEILELRPLTGPSFAQKGQTVQAFTVGYRPKLESGDLIKAQAEFVGDEAGGAFTLTDIERQQGTS